MKIVFLITLVESLVVASWLVLRRFRNEYSRIQPGPAMIPVRTGSRSTASVPAAGSHWIFINNWQVEDQADDRGLTVGAVAVRAGSSPERRSFARRSHQRSFKIWSQARHD